MSSFASAASARNCATASSGSPAIARKRLMMPSASRGSAPPFSVDCSRKRSAISDDRAPADIGGAGDRHQIGHQRQRRLAVGAGERRQHALIFVAAGSGRERQPLEVLLQADLAVEILDQPPPPHRIEIERIDQRIEQRDVAGADFDLVDPERARSLPAPAPASRRRRRRDPAVRRIRCRPAGIRSAGRRDSGTPARDS